MFLLKVNFTTSHVYPETTDFAFLGFLGIWLGRLGIVGLCVSIFRVYRKDTVDEDEVGHSCSCYTPCLVLTFSLTVFRCS